MHYRKNWPKYLQKKRLLGSWGPYSQQLCVLLAVLQSVTVGLPGLHLFELLTGFRESLKENTILWLTGIWFWRLFFFFLLLAGFDSLHRYAKEEEPRCSFMWLTIGSLVFNLQLGKEVALFSQELKILKHICCAIIQSCAWSFCL